MRILIALVALWALIVQPATASGHCCCQARTAAAAARVTSVDPSASMSMTPCDAPASRRGTMDKGCAGACAATCDFTVALAPPLVDLPAPALGRGVLAHRLVFASTLQPATLDPPPKSIA